MIVVKRKRSKLSTRIGVLVLLALCFLYAFFQNQTQMTSTLSMFTEQEVDEGARDDKLSVVPVGNDFQLAKDQSFGFFTDISSKQWEMHQKIVAEYVRHKNPMDPLEFVPGHSIKRGDWVNSARAFYQTNYEPNFSCALERRVGGNGNGDGPKWVCDPHRIKELSMTRKKETNGENGCLVYSIGSQGDFQFEVGLQKLLGNETCEVHIFDFYDYRHKMPKDMNLHYHPWGLKKKGVEFPDVVNGKPADTKKQFYSIDEIVEKLGHKDRTIDIFKIDCEDCEWKTFDDWLDPAMPMIQQILVETHKAPLDDVVPFFNGIMDRGYVMFHKEPNIQFAGGDCVEFGFLKFHDKFFDDAKVITVASN